VPRRCSSWTSSRTGGIGVVGVYVPEDPGVQDSSDVGGIGWDDGTFFTKGQSMGTGQAPVKRYNRQLRDLIIAGRATLGWPKVLLHP
jgi:glutathione-independent formaldehyde dehydrogenase